MMSMQVDVVHNKSCEQMNEINDQSVDMVFADPPFNVGKKYGLEGDRRTDYYEWCEEWIDACFRKLKNTGTFYLMTISRHLEKLYPMLSARGVFISQVIWRHQAGANDKRRFWAIYQPILMYGKTENYIFNTYTQTRILKKNLRWGKYRTEPRGQLTDYWDDIPFVYAGSIHHKEAILIPGTNKKAHPTQMPRGLAIRAILFSTNEGDIVLDPFMGSGTTAVACKITHRHYVGYEISKRYCEKLIKPALENIDPLFHYKEDAHPT